MNENAGQDQFTLPDGRTVDTFSEDVFDLCIAEVRQIKEKVAALYNDIDRLHLPELLHWKKAIRKHVGEIKMVCYDGYGTDLDGQVVAVVVCRGKRRKIISKALE